VKVRQKVEIVYKWKYLFLGVDVIHGSVQWSWIDRVDAEQVRGVLENGEWGAVVWDRAGSHRSRRVGELKIKRLFLPPWSPELNPAERVIEEIRRGIEGEVYRQLEAKQEAAERVVRKLAGDPAAVRRLTGWHWIQEAFEQLPHE